MDKQSKQSLEQQRIDLPITEINSVKGKLNPIEDIGMVIALMIATLSLKFSSTYAVKEYLMVPTYFGFGAITIIILFLMTSNLNTKTLRRIISVIDFKIILLFIISAAAAGIFDIIGFTILLFGLGSGYALSQLLPLAGLNTPVVLILSYFAFKSTKNQFKQDLAFNVFGKEFQFSGKVLLFAAILVTAICIFLLN